MTTLKTPEEIAISMWNKGGHGLELDEVVAMMNCDRQHIAEVLCDLLEGEKAESYDEKSMSTEETATYNAALTKAQALIRQTLEPISNQE